MMSQRNNNGEAKEEQSKARSVPTHTKKIGIIRPHPDIIEVIKKTAIHVSKHGPEFENKIINEKINTPSPDQKFSFLISSDTYHAFYQQCLSELRSQIDQSFEEPALVEDVEPKPDPSDQFRPVCKVPEQPEADEFTVHLPEGISGEELELIKLTAQFVARNGKSFLTELIGREMSNPQFNFLKPKHSMFKYFNSMVDSYSKVLMPLKGLTEKLKKRADMTSVLEKCMHRLEWENYQEKERQKTEDETEQEMIQMDAIDWHDNKVVATIDFNDDEDENLPPPLTPEDIIRRSKGFTAEDDVKDLGQKVIEMELDEEEMQLIEEAMEVTDVDPQQTQQTPMRIVKNWKRPEERIIQCSAKRDIMISPITGELIPVNEMSEHMRISLIDPKYREQKERMLAKIRETGLVLAQDDEISANIVNLAQTRPDIFGSTEEEVSNAVKAETENKEKYQQVVWNGHAGRPPIPMSSGHQSLLVNQPPLPPLTFMNVVPAPPPPASHQFTPMQVLQRPYIMPTMHMKPSPPLPREMPMPPPLPPLAEEPEPKRQKLDDSMLVPEDEFLAQHPGPIGIRISVPSEVNLKGGVLEFTLQSLSERVGNLKERISGETQLPANKQKLSGKPGFLKDNLSLAYYNVGAGETLALSIRERGGRKR